MKLREVKQYVQSQKASKQQTQDANSRCKPRPPTPELSSLCCILQPLAGNRVLKPKARTYGLKRICIFIMITAQNGLESFYFYFILKNRIYQSNDAKLKKLNSTEKKIFFKSQQPTPFTLQPYFPRTTTINSFSCVPVSVFFYPTSQNHVSISDFYLLTFG